MSSGRGSIYKFKIIIDKRTCVYYKLIGHIAQKVKMCDRTLDELLSELSEKEEELLLSASYGKTLLEENERIKLELQATSEERAHLKESLQSQKLEAQRSLLYAKASADSYITELEDQLKCCKATMTQERNNFESMRKEYEKNIEELQTENSRLITELNKLKAERSLDREKHHQIQKALKEFEGQGQGSSEEYDKLQKLVESLQDSNKCYSTDVSILTKACDKLCHDLQDTQTQLEHLERQYIQLNEEFQTRGKVLEDSQDLISELQLQVDYQRESIRTPNSTASGMSLHDELSQSNCSLNMRLSPDDDLPLSEEDISVPFTTEHTVNVQLQSESGQSMVETLRLTDHPKLSVWSSGSENSDYLCYRCKEFSDQLAGYKQELEGVNEQLMVAVQQKFELQQQNEAWQSDMTELINKRIHRKLHKDVDSKLPKDKHRPVVKEGEQKDSSSSRDPNQELDRGLSYHIIKDSWLF